MKRFLAWVLFVTFMLPMGAACAETDDSIFETLASAEWSFCSGVGAWSTDLYIQPDGSFTGEFHDSDMGDMGEGYPHGTVYLCTFAGQMSLTGQVDEYTWTIRIDQLQVDERQPEQIEDGIRYVSSEPYGLSQGDEMLLHRPGTPVSTLTEEMLIWAHVLDQENPPAELQTWFLSSEKNESGFVGNEVPAVSMANPWEDMTADQLLEASGLSFGIPDGAENPVFRYLRNEELAEMQFTMDGDEFCARIQPTALQEGEMPDISGMYFAWEQEETVQIGHCTGTVALVQTGSEDWIELCQWYDAVPGLMYSLSVYTTDPDGLDLTAVAEMVFVPVQGDG